MKPQEEPQKRKGPVRTQQSNDNNKLSVPLNQDKSQDQTSANPLPSFDAPFNMVPQLTYSFDILNSNEGTPINENSCSIEITARIDPHSINHAGVDHGPFDHQQFMMEQLKYMKRRDIRQMQKNLDIHLAHRPPNLLNFFGTRPKPFQHKIEVKDEKEQQQLEEKTKPIEFSRSVSANNDSKIIPGFDPLDNTKHGRDQRMNIQQETPSQSVSSGSSEEDDDSNQDPAKAPSIHQQSTTNQLNFDNMKEAPLKKHNTLRGGQDSSGIPSANDPNQKIKSLVSTDGLNSPSQQDVIKELTRMQDQFVAAHQTLQLQAKKYDVNDLLKPILSTRHYRRIPETKQQGTDGFEPMTAVHIPTSLEGDLRSQGRDKLQAMRNRKMKSQRHMVIQDQPDLDRHLLFQPKESEVGEQTTLYCDSPTYSKKKRGLNPLQTRLRRKESGKLLAISLQQTGSLAESSDVKRGVEQATERRGHRSTPSSQRQTQHQNSQYSAVGGVSNQYIRLPEHAIKVTQVQNRPSERVASAEYNPLILGMTTQRSPNYNKFSLIKSNFFQSTSNSNQVPTGKVTEDPNSPDMVIRKQVLHQGGAKGNTIVTGSQASLQRLMTNEDQNTLSAAHLHSNVISPKYFNRNQSGGTTNPFKQVVKRQSSASNTLVSPSPKDTARAPGPSKKESKSTGIHGDRLMKFLKTQYNTISGSDQDQFHYVAPEMTEFKMSLPQSLTSSMEKDGAEQAKFNYFGKKTQELKKFKTFNFQALPGDAAKKKQLGFKGQTKEEPPSRNNALSSTKRSGTNSKGRSRSPAEKKIDSNFQKQLTTSSGVSTINLIDCAKLLKMQDRRVRKAIEEAIFHELRQLQFQKENAPSKSNPRLIIINTKEDSREGQITPGYSTRQGTFSAGHKEREVMFSFQPAIRKQTSNDAMNGRNKEHDNVSGQLQTQKLSDGDQNSLNDTYIISGQQAFGAMTFANDDSPRTNDTHHEILQKLRKSSQFKRGGRKKFFEQGGNRSSEHLQESRKPRGKTSKIEPFFNIVCQPEAGSLEETALLDRTVPNINSEKQFEVTQKLKSKKSRAPQRVFKSISKGGKTLSKKVYTNGQNTAEGSKASMESSAITKQRSPTTKLQQGIDNFGSKQTSPFSINNMESAANSKKSGARVSQFVDLTNIGKSNKEAQFQTINNPAAKDKDLSEPGGLNQNGSMQTLTSLSKGQRQSMASRPAADVKNKNMFSFDQLPMTPPFLSNPISTSNLYQSGSPENNRIQSQVFSAGVLSYQRTEVSNEKQLSPGGSGGTKQDFSEANPLLQQLMQQQQEQYQQLLELNQKTKDAMKQNQVLLQKVGIPSDFLSRRAEFGQIKQAKSQQQVKKFNPTFFQDSKATDPDEGDSRVHTLHDEQPIATQHHLFKINLNPNTRKHYFQKVKKQKIIKNFNEIAPYQTKPQPPAVQTLTLSMEDQPQATNTPADGFTGMLLNTRANSQANNTQLRITEGGGKTLRIKELCLSQEEGEAPQTIPTNRNVFSAGIPKRAMIAKRQGPTSSSRFKSPVEGPLKTDRSSQPATQRGKPLSSRTQKSGFYREEASPRKGPDAKARPDKFTNIQENEAKATTIVIGQPTKIPKPKGEEQTKDMMKNQLKFLGSQYNLVTQQRNQAALLNPVKSQETGTKFSRNSKENLEKPQIPKDPSQTILPEKSPSNFEIQSICQSSLKEYNLTMANDNPSNVSVTRAFSKQSANLLSEENFDNQLLKKKQLKQSRQGVFNHHHLKNKDLNYPENFPIYSGGNEMVNESLRIDRHQSQQLITPRAESPTSKAETKVTIEVGNILRPTFQKPQDLQSAQLRHRKSRNPKDSDEPTIIYSSHGKSNKSKPSSSRKVVINSVSPKSPATGFVLTKPLPIVPIKGSIVGKVDEKGETVILSERSCRANTAREVHRLKYTGNAKNHFRTILVHGAGKKKSMPDQDLQTLLAKRKQSKKPFGQLKASLAGSQTSQQGRETARVFETLKFSTSSGANLKFDTSRTSFVGRRPIATISQVKLKHPMTKAAATRVQGGKMPQKAKKEAAVDGFNCAKIDISKSKNDEILHFYKEKLKEEIKQNQANHQKQQTEDEEVDLKDFEQNLLEEHKMNLEFEELIKNNPGQFSKEEFRRIIVHQISKLQKFSDKVGSLEHSQWISEEESSLSDKKIESEGILEAPNRKLSNIFSRQFTQSNQIMQARGYSHAPTFDEGGVVLKPTLRDQKSEAGGSRPQAKSYKQRFMNIEQIKKFRKQIKKQNEDLNKPVRKPLKINPSKNSSAAQTPGDDGPLLSRSNEIKLDQILSKYIIDQSRQQSQLKYLSNPTSSGDQQQATGQEAIINLSLPAETLQNKMSDSARLQSIHKRGTLLIPNKNAVLIETEASPTSEDKMKNEKKQMPSSNPHKRYTFIESEFDIGRGQKEAQLLSDEGDDFTEDHQVDLHSSSDLTGEVMRKREVQSLNSSAVPARHEKPTSRKKPLANPHPSFLQHPAPFIFEKKEKQFLGVHQVSPTRQAQRSVAMSNKSNALEEVKCNTDLDQLQESARKDSQSGATTARVSMNTNNKGSMRFNLK